MKRYDAIVVGGGPAGSTTAYRLAEQGVSVLLADRAKFPRDKPCGGRLTIRAVRQCPVDPTPVVEELVDAVQIRFRYREAVVRSAGKPVIWMTQRRRLDAFLLDSARERGVEVREGARVAVGEGNTVSLGGNETVAADVIVAADGVNGTTARAVGLGQEMVYGVGYEGNVSNRSLNGDHREGCALIEIADIPGGYAWLFPKGDHANIGVWTWEGDAQTVRAHLATACEGYGLDAATLENLRGHRLPMRSKATRIAGERALAVGDAAGHADPVSGDGMYECFVSSRLAAGSILDLLAGRATSLVSYEAAVDRELAALHAASWRIKKALDRWPRASWHVLRTKLLWTTIQGLIEGSIAEPGERRGLPRATFRMLELLGR